MAVSFGVCFDVIWLTALTDRLAVLEFEELRAFSPCFVVGKTLPILPVSINRHLEPYLGEQLSSTLSP